MFLSKISAGIAVGTSLLLGASPALAASAWTSVPVPPTGQNANLMGVSSTSDSDAWAVGSENGSAGAGVGAKVLIDHWNGTAWSQVATPATPQNTASLAAVSASSTTDAWAIGRDQNNRSNFQPLALHWNGTSWTRVTVPLPNNDNLASDLYAISADGPNDVWIVGTYYLLVSPTDEALETYSLHWNGTAWSIVPMPPVPGTNPNNQFVLDAIQAKSPTDVWAVGKSVNAASPSSATTLTEHWNGTTWSIVPSPSPSTGASLTGVTTSNASNSVWAVGVDQPSGSTTAQTLTLNWNGTAWVTVPSPNASTGPTVLNSVSTTPGASIVQALGESGVSGANNPFAPQNG